VVPVSIKSPAKSLIIVDIFAAVCLVDQDGYDTASSASHFGSGKPKSPSLSRGERLG